MKINALRINYCGKSVCQALLAAVMFCLLGTSAMAADKVEEGVQQVLPAPAVKAKAEVASVAPSEGETMVSINQADAEQLASVLNGVGLKKAEAIVRYREQNGPFTAIEQLQEVPGIGPALVERNRARLKM